MNPSQDNFRDLVENFHDGIYFVDCDRTITYWNRGAEELTGYSADEVLGRRCLDAALQPHKLLLEQKRIHLDRPAKDAHWPTDRPMLHRILSNLISNAIYYGDEEG